MTTIGRVVVENCMVSDPIFHSCSPLKLRRPWLHIHKRILDAMSIPARKDCASAIVVVRRILP